MYFIFVTYADEAWPNQNNKLMSLSFFRPSLDALLFLAALKTCQGRARKKGRG